MSEQKRRIDRVLGPDFGADIETLPLDEARLRRDECLAEREFLSYLRRMLHGRLEILRAEAEARKRGEGSSLVERLPSILGGDMPRAPSRGEVLRLHLPEEDLEEARRRVEGLLGPAAFSDPASLDDQQLEEAIGAMEAEERRVSDTRRAVMDLQDRFQDQVKSRYKERLASS